MAEDFISLAIIAVVAFACPIVARIAPGKLIPETVFLMPLLASVTHRISLAVDPSQSAL